MTVMDVYRWLDFIAPFDSAESYDNCGIIVGEPTAKVSSVLFTVDITPAVVDEAAKLGAELIVSHHPLMFNPTRQIRFDLLEGATIKALCTRSISLIAAHTNLDKAKDGIGDSLAKELGLINVRVGSDGFVRIGELPRPMPNDEAASWLESVIGNQVRHYAPDTACREITTLAIGAGTYSEGFRVALEGGAQAYLSGEIKHHDALHAVYAGLALYECGHYATERFGVAALYRRFVRQVQQTGVPVEAKLSLIAPYFGATHTP